MLLRAIIRVTTINGRRVFDRSTERKTVENLCIQNNVFFFISIRNSLSRSSNTECPRKYFNSVYNRQ